MVMGSLGQLLQNALHGKKKKAENIMRELEFWMMWAKDSNLSSAKSRPHREGGPSSWEFIAVLL